ncbi:MAG: hypothetical protein CMB61_04230 [Euryarchaeota archaeon]|nr:hypothetical protein [Euryarchaeota archaeon]
MEDKPESVEIASGFGENTFVGEQGSSESNVTLLSGEVSSFNTGSDGLLGSANDPTKIGGLPNWAWFATGLIVYPIVTWVIYAIFMMTSFDILDGPDILILFGFLIWPISFIGGIVWGFSRGNKYFAYGIITVASILLLLFLALVGLIIITLGSV